MSNTISIVDQNVKLYGSIISTGIIDWLGFGNGIIICKKLHIKANGQFIGKVFAETIIVESGQVIGDINAINIKFCAKANIEGQVIYSKMSIEDGAVLSCTCKRESQEEISKQIEKITNDNLDKSKNIEITKDINVSNASI